MNKLYEELLHANSKIKKLERRIKELTAGVLPVYPADMHGRPVTANSSEWCYDMGSAPVGGKLLVLNKSNVATLSVLTSDDKQYFQAWAPLPKRKK
jgi:hypothetical protein